MTTDSISYRLPAGTRNRLLTTWGVLKNPRHLFVKCLERYGDPFLLNALNGPVVVTGREDLVSAVFRADASHFEVFGGQSAIPVLGRGSLIMMDGDIHRRERKLMAPMFHGQRMRAYADQMRDAALNATKQYLDGQPFNAIDLGTKISLDVIVRTLFGADDAEQRAKIEALTVDTLRRTSPVLFFSPRSHFKFLGMSPMDRFRAARSRLSAEMDAELARRGDSIHERDDILSIMASTTYDDGELIERDHLHDAMGTLLFAGHETTAIALAWALYHLHCNPVWLNRLRAEALDHHQSDAAQSEITKRPVLRGVIDETLRIHPIVTEVLRKLKRPFDLGEYRLPPGHAVAPAAAISHYDPQVFPEPVVFDPGRFIGKSYSPSQYMPFGGGQRRCIGAAFSTYELAVVLTALLTRFDFELLESRTVGTRRRNITMGPATGIRMRLLRDRQ